MNNKEIIDEIRSHLTKEKDIDITYLQTELEIYKKMNNEEVIYAIANMLFQYLDPKIKEQLDLKTHAILDERRQEYERVVKLLADEKFQEAKEILLKLSHTFKKASYVREQNYYDFDQMIEYFIFCENVDNAKNLKIKRYPEPVTYYMYQLSSIYQLENNLEEAISALEEALNYNPRCQYVMQELVLLYDKVNRDEEAFELIKESLKYAYTKEQLANAYQYIAYFYEKKKCYDIAIIAYLTSDNYRIKQINKDLVNNLVEKNGKVNIQNMADVESIFAKYHLQHGVSFSVIKTINESIQYAKVIKDYETVLYLLNIAIELTDDKYYKEQLPIAQKLLKEKKQCKQK